MTSDGGDMVERAIAALEARKAIYEEMMARRDPFAADDMNPHGRSQFAVEVMEHAIADVLAALSPMTSPDGERA